MKSGLRRSICLAAFVALVVASCVELTGQRIAWFHDVERDELRFILAYDGIHDDEKQESTILGRGPRGKEQLTNFVAAGDVMLFDWFFHLNRARFDALLDTEELSPARREFLAYAKEITVSAAGHYRDHEGRIGALQHIVIPGARRFIGELNAAIRESIVAQTDNGDGGLPRSRAALLAACESEHEFVALDGQAFVFTIPIDREEFRAMKHEYFVDLFADAVGLKSKDLGQLADTTRALGGILSSLSTSWIEEPDRIKIVLGDRDRSNLLRVTLRDEYDTNLEADVARLVPAALDEAILDNALAPQPAKRSSIADLLAFGPPEITAMALARVADDAASPHATDARAKLFSMASAWNAAGRLPQAPTRLPEGATHVATVTSFVHSLQIRGK